MTWAFVASGFVFLVLAGGSYAGSAGPGIRTVTQLAVLSLLGGWLVASARDSWWLPRSSLFLPGLIALVGLLLTALFAADVRLALGGVAVAALTFAGLLLTQRLWEHPFTGPRILQLMTLLPAAVAGVYLGQVALLWIEWWQLVGQLAIPPMRPDWAGLTLGSPNLVATVLLVTSPLSVALVMGAGAASRKRWMAATAILVLAIVTVVVTGSRGGALGLAVAFGVGLMGAILRARRLSRGVTIALVVAAVVIAAGALVVVLGRGSQGGEGLRLELWRTALAIFADDPITGAGPNGWALLRLAEARPFEPTVVVPHAHNVYLWTLAELGIVGTTACAGFLVSVAALLVRRSRSSDPVVATAALAGMAAFAGLAAQSLVDVVTNLPGIVLLVGVVTAISLEGRPPWSANSVIEPERGFLAVRPSAGRRTAALVIGGLGIAGLALGYSASNGAADAAALARQQLVAGDDAAAATGFAEAFARDPISLYRAEQAVAAAFEGDGTTARTLAERVATEIALAHYQVLAGYLALDAGDMQAGIAAAHVAIDRGWPDPGVMLNASRIGELAGDKALAELGLVLAASLAPTALGDPYWSAAERPIDYATLIDAAAQEARARLGPGQEALVLAFGGRTEDALARVEAVAPLERGRLAAIVTSVSDPLAGRAALQAIIQAQPHDWVAAAWLARLEAEAGDLDEARRHARWAMIVQGDSAGGVLTLPRQISGGRGGPQFRLPGQYPWPIYRQNDSGLLFGPDAVSLTP